MILQATEESAWVPRTPKQKAPAVDAMDAVDAMLLLVLWMVLAWMELQWTKVMNVLPCQLFNLN